jgi:hypothetical protein
LNFKINQKLGNLNFICIFSFDLLFFHFLKYYYLKLSFDLYTRKLSCLSYENLNYMLSSNFEIQFLIVF